MHSTSLTTGTNKHGVPNALYDSLNRIVCSFPDPGIDGDTRRGSPSTPETIHANARLFTAAPALLDALHYLLEQTVDQDLTHGIELTEGEQDARLQALAAIAATV
jgi:hypothetical protein